MRSYRILGMLTHQTTVQRDANANTLNAAGAQESPSWGDHLTDLPCRFWTTSGREQLDPTTSVVAEQMKMIVELGTDVTEQDRLSDITVQGSVIAEGPIGIRAVIAREDHLELVLERIS